VVVVLQGNALLQYRTINDSGDTFLLKGDPEKGFSIRITF